MTNPDVFEIDEVLLSEMQEAGLVEESKANLYRSRKKLQESLIEENAKPHRTPTEYEMGGIIVSWDQFKRVYTDYENYPTLDDVMNALGLPRNMFDDYSKGTHTRRLNRIRHHFMEKNREGSIVAVGFPQREKVYYLDDFPQADTRNINPGKRNQRKASTPVVDMLNNQKVVPGEFYSDMSRIPRRRWGSWVKFWERQVSRIKNPKSILGRVWSKTFIMGYQFHKSAVVEIWYSSATSDFNVYDHNGAALGRPSATLQEAVRLFVTFLVREYASDEEVFRGRGESQKLAQSYMAAIKRGAQRDAIEAEREASLAAREEKRRGNVHGTVSLAVKKAKADVKSSREAKAERKEAARKQKEQNSQTDSSASKNKSFSGKAKDAAASVVNKFRKERGFEEISPEEYAKYNFEQREKEAKAYQNQRDRANQRARDEYEKRTGTTINQGMDPRPAALTQQKEPSTKAGPVGYDVFNRPSDNGIPPSIKADQLIKLQQDYEAKRREYEQLQKQLDSINAEIETGKGLEIPPEELTMLSSEKNKVSKEIKKRKNELKLKSEKLKKLGIDSPFTKRSVNESVEEEFEDIDFEAASAELDQAAIARRKMAETSGFTTTAIRTAAMGELLSMYTETRVNKKDASTLGRYILNFSRVFRGRKAPVRLPTKSASPFDRIRMALYGVNYRADFVVGFSLKDSINIEVWYVTEPDPKKPNQISSSFYVYDVTAGKVVRANLPYYRNALQVVLAKIGVS